MVEKTGIGKDVHTVGNGNPPPLRLPPPYYWLLTNLFSFIEMTYRWEWTREEWIREEWIGEEWIREEQPVLS